MLKSDFFLPEKLAFLLERMFYLKGLASKKSGKIRKFIIFKHTQIILKGNYSKPFGPKIGTKSIVVFFKLI